VVQNKKFILLHYLKEIKATPKEIQMVLLKSSTQYALPAKQVDTMIEQRRKDFLAEAEKLEMIELGNPQNTEVIDIADIAEKAQLPRKPSKKKA